MTSRAQLENLINIAVLLGRAVPARTPELLARNLGKLQKLSVGLRKRHDATTGYSYAQTANYLAQTAKLQSRARELAHEMGLEIIARDAPRTEAVIGMIIKGSSAKLYWLF